MGPRSKSTKTIEGRSYGYDHNHSYRLCSCRPHRGCACQRPCHAAPGLAENARHAADTLRVHNVAAGSVGMVTDPDSSPGNLRLGVVLFVARMPAGRRVFVLFFRRHLHDHRLWGPCVTEAVANTWAGGGADRHPHVRIVGRPVLRGRRQDLRVALQKKLG